MKIKDLPSNYNLRGVKFRSNEGTIGYWYSQWGYEDGKAGIWFKKNMDDSRVYPLFLDSIEEILEFEVLKTPWEVSINRPEDKGENKK